MTSDLTPGLPIMHARHLLESYCMSVNSSLRCKNADLQTPTNEGVYRETLLSVTVRGEVLDRWAVSSCLSQAVGAILAMVRRLGHTQRSLCMLWRFRDSWCPASPKRRESVLSDIHTALKNTANVNQHHTSCAGLNLLFQLKGGQISVAEILLKIVNSFLKSPLSGCGGTAALPALGRQRQNQELQTCLHHVVSAGDPILKTKQTPNTQFSFI